MSNPIQQGIDRTGWSEDVISYLYEEFCDLEEGEDFLEYLADQTATAAFVIAASEGMAVTMCLEAYDQGRSCVLDDDFDIDSAIDAINLADLPDDPLDDTSVFFDTEE
jgi:hypothetical protein